MNTPSAFTVNRNRSSRSRLRPGRHSTRGFIVSESLPKEAISARHSTLGKRYSNGGAISTTFSSPAIAPEIDQLDSLTSNQIQDRESMIGENWFVRVHHSCLNEIKWEREILFYRVLFLFLKRNFKTDASRFSAVPPPSKWDGNFCARLHKAGIAETILRAASLLPKL